jgi:hypothetical protein
LRVTVSRVATRDKLEKGGFRTLHAFTFGQCEAQYFVAEELV